MTIRVAHLYPEYLNIYADRGNIAVLVEPGRAGAASGSRSRRSAWATSSRPGEHDLLYIGGGQDREQALIAPDLAARGEAIREAVGGGAARARRVRRIPAAGPRSIAAGTAPSSRAPGSFRSRRSRASGG